MTPRAAATEPQSGPTGPAGGRSAQPQPAIAILIPTKNRHASLRRSLATIGPAANRVGAAILICDQSDQPFADPGPWRVIHAPDCSGLPAARNLLLNASTADLACFCDDDVDMAADFCQVLRDTASQAPADVSAWGPVVECRPLPQRRLHRLAQVGAQRDPRRLLASPCNARTTMLFGCCFAVWRSTACAHPFDSRLTGYALGEDADFFRRLPGSKHFVAGLRLVHREDGNGRADPRQRGRQKAAYLLRCARHAGRHNPASILHLILALLAAASGQGREPAAWQGILDGLRRPA